MTDDDPFASDDDEDDGCEEPPEPQLFAYEENKRVVVFADMLGFSKLTLKHSIEPDVFLELQRPGNVAFLRASLEDAHANLLSERFIRFHLLAAESAAQVRMVEDGESITFSDCAFFATNKLYAAAEYATTLVRSALEVQIPVRIGIAAGEFLVVRIRADFGMTNQDHIVQFLGSGVSLANATEHCGVKGCRILLHESAKALTAEAEQMGPFRNIRSPFQILPLPEEETKSKAGVFQEIGYLGHLSRQDELWKAVNEMAAASEDEEQIQYVATRNALNRMRAASGQPPFAP